MRTQNLPLSVLNLLGFLGTIIVNILANALPINNKTTGALSDQYPNLFVPAGFTFSIWGLIYILLAIFTIYQFRIVIRKNTQQSSFLEKIGPFFFVSSIANISWIFAWHYEIVSLSILLMLLLLGCLIAIYVRLNIGKSASTKSEKFLVHLPFSVYLGWITIATIANTIALLVDLNWDKFGFGEQFWAVAIIAAAIAIALRILFARKDIFYCLVVDWALLGILIKRLAVDGASDNSVIVISIIGLVLISAGIIIQIKRGRVYWNDREALDFST
jgi:hypothetical protein